MRGLAIVATLLAAALRPAPAQQQAKELIDQGIALYENFQPEAARPLFQRVVSPNFLGTVLPEHRVTALKYLGASYAILGNPDSATIFFSAALEVDPFTDLEQEKFSASELGPFDLAKNAVFRVGIRPTYSAVVNPRATSTAYNFQLVSTHRASLTVELIRLPDSTMRETLFSGQNSGLKAILWDGFMRSVGKIADSANYVLKVTATSTLPRTATQAAFQPATETEFLKIEHSYAPLEDTLPTLPAALLLEPSIPPLAPWSDLAKGVGFGAVAFGVAAIAVPRPGDWQVHAGVAAGVSVVSGVVSWAYRSRNRAIPENVAENARRQQQRREFNDGVNARNADRIAQTLLIITPVTGIR